MPKNAFYFPHDSNARHDPKILKLRSHYKLEGLGLYWACIEMMREQNDYRLPLDDDSLGGYAQDLGCSIDLLKSFLKDCISYGLFQTDNEMFWSESLIRRMGKFEEKSDQATEAINKRWHPNNKRTTDVLPENNGRINDKKDGSDNDITDTKDTDVLPENNGRNTIKEDNIKRDNIKENNNNYLPDFIDKELWNDFLEMRKKKKIPYTERAGKLLIKRLTEFKELGLNPNEALENSIMGGWQGVFAPQKKQEFKSKHNDGWK